MQQHPDSMSQEQQVFRTMSMSKSVDAALPPTLDEDLPAEGDEPPERHSGLNSDSDFAKHTIKQNKPPQSLLARGLVEAKNPPPKRVSRLTFGTSSTSSYLSAASTADLTSDAGSTDVSRTSSPVFPTFILPNIDTFPGFKKPVRTSSIDSHCADIQIVDNSTDDSLENFQRRRRITFASDVKLPARQPCARYRPASPAPQRRNVRPASPAPQRRIGIKFAVGEKPVRNIETNPSTPRPSSPSPRKQSIRFACPDKVTAEQKISATPALTAHIRSDSQSTITAMSPVTRFVSARQSIPEKQVDPSKLKKFYEFASSCSEDESWMDLTMEKKGLMKVDDIMKKEKDIQKLSRECSDEFNKHDDDDEEEEDDDEDDVEAVDDYDEEDEDEEEYEDEEDEEEEEEDFSGNETDNEDGFASDSDGESNSFFGSFAPPTTFFNNIGHVFKRRMSADSDVSGIAPETTVVPQAPAASVLEQAELPDSTDFVCGTLDEDKPLEEAFKHKLEEVKKAEQGIYYIDPDFPASDNDDEDNDDEDEDEDSNLPMGRMSRSNSPVSRGRLNEMDRSPRRFHSPPPKPAGRIYRHMSPPPKPIRRNSRQLSPPPKPVRRGSRHLSPPPPRRRRNSHNERTIHPDLKTKSLPRASSMYKAKKSGSKTNSPSTSPRTEAVAIARPRGAMDIVKGMERRKERRKARLQRKEDGVAPGEGVEKMRQLGLGKAPANPQWIFSV